MKLQNFMGLVESLPRIDEKETKGFSCDTF
jgi:hypothetical protein